MSAPRFSLYPRPDRTPETSLSEALPRGSQGPPQPQRPKSVLERLSQPTSFWLHDDSDNEAPVSKEMGPLRKRWTRPKRKHVIVVCITAAILFIGAILGGVLGTMAASNHPMAPPPRNSSHEGGGDGSKGGGGGSKTIEVSIHPSSQLGTASVSNPISSFNMLIFHDIDLQLLAIEWRGSESETYILKDRMEDQEPPQPLEGTPFCLANFGDNDDSHLFYLDHDHQLVHLVREFSERNESTWRLGAFATESGEAGGPVVPHMRFSVTVFPELDIKDSQARLAVLYHTGKDSSEVILTTNPNPGGTDNWSSSKFSFSGLDISAHPKADLPGLLVMPSTATLARKKPGEAIRVLWDESNIFHRATFGMMSCIMDKGTKVKKETCLSTGQFKDKADRDPIAKAPKPLRLSTAIFARSPDKSGKFVMDVLDGDGNLHEIYWDGSRFSGYKAFSMMLGSPQPEAKDTFASVSITESGSLFAVSDGKLLGYERRGNWWESDHESESGWHFTGVVNATITVPA